MRFLGFLCAVFGVFVCGFAIVRFLMISVFAVLWCSTLLIRLVVMKTWIDVACTFFQSLSYRANSKESGILRELRID